jgi:hypothetical protein
MSLAMLAAPFNEINETSENRDNILNEKRHKKTLKKYPKIENFYNKEKVNSVLQKLHENDNDDDDDDRFDFNPPPKPQSAGVDKTIPKIENNTENFTIGKTPIPYLGNDIANGKDNLDLNDYNNYGDAKTVEEYYKKVLPSFYKHNPNNRLYYTNQSQSQSHIQGDSQDTLMQKLNYIITLLEEQKDEKTNSVTEEVILYSFLGIFIIFIADTFVKAGKYTR